MTKSILPALIENNAHLEEAAIQTVGEGGGKDQRGEDGSGDSELGKKWWSVAIALARRLPGATVWLDADGRRSDGADLAGGKSPILV